MIRAYGKNLLVKLLEPPKKKGFLIIEEEPDHIARCEFIDSGMDTTHHYDYPVVLLFRRYELRDCVDKQEKLYIISEDCLLGYEEEKNGQEDAKADRPTA